MKRIGIAAVVIFGVLVAGFIIAAFPWEIVLGEGGVAQTPAESDAILAAHRAVTVGTPEAVVHRRLGDPYFDMPITVGGRTARCRIYLFYDQSDEHILFRFCFAGGRYVESPDPLEPNDDVYFVRRNGLLRPDGAPAVNEERRGPVSLTARLDHSDELDEFSDAVDVYRVYVRPRRALRVRAVPTADVDLEVFDATTPTVFVEGDARERHFIAGSYRAGARTEDVTIYGRPGRVLVVYVAVYLLEGGPNHAEYELTVSPVG